ncbi:hypothetical protein GALL_101920 [mine drainage metagenome]|uniref:Vitamin B12 transporter BtuB n=1 Tax=mine drainage metagenome TaxID=410659 RepID=A0A1J5SHY8_9ZZZZ
MNNHKKILIFLMAAIAPFVVVQAQHRHKAKKKKTVARKTVTKKAVVADRVNTIRATDVVLSNDSIPPKEVTVTSVFKPSLRNAAKINFTAATPVIDSTKIPLTYNIPSQNLFFSYQPVSIKPLELSIDTTFHWENDQYIKAGFGNYSTPYLETALAFGDGKKSIINLRGNYTSSKGNITFQEFTKAGVEGLGIFNSVNNELTSRIYFNNSTQYRYPSSSIFPNVSKEDLQQQFNQLGFELGLQNKMPTDFGITYHPQIKLNSFFDNRSGSELNFILKAPINKALGKIFALDLKFTADVTALHTSAISSINNNLFYIDPSVQFNTPNFKLNAGIRPSWDNSIFSMLPNVTIEAKLKDEHLVFQAGWIGYYNKNTYQSLAAFNPYIQQPTSLLNTKIMEQYAGFKGGAGKHVTFNARLSFLKINNQALFANDPAAVTVKNTQSFIVLYEPQLQAIRLHGEIGYTLQEKLTFSSAVNYTQYTSQQLYDKPWGILPLEVSGSVRYKVMKGLQLKSDIFFWDGAQYRNQSLQSQKLAAAMDLNAGAEFSVLPHLNIWVQFNNLLNSKYQRWDQYEVLGFNVLGGVVYSFR